MKKNYVLLVVSLLLFSINSFAAPYEYFCPNQVVCTGATFKECKPVVNGKTQDWGFWGGITWQAAPKGTYNLVKALAKKDTPMPGDGYCWYTSPSNPTGITVTTGVTALQAEIGKGGWICTNQYCYVANNPLDPHAAPFIEKHY